ncbi:MAG: nuclear transport factor 2 family protein [Gemmataceae bacterium]|nr:nuclear transport factor 2 family protein [Gemmataceae bacterium]
MKCPVLAVAALCLLGILAPAPAQTPKEDPAHDELRALFKEVLDAYNKADYDRLITYLDDDVVVIWQNADVSKKPAGVKEYFDKMMKGPNAVVKSAKIDPTVDDLTHLYGDTGVAYGSSKDQYVLTDGTEFVQNTRWSASVVKRGGKWKVASVHISTNMFDNPILDMAVKKTMWMAGGGGVVIGFLVGFLLARLFGGRTA